MKINQLLYFFVRLPKKTVTVFSVAALIACGGGQSADDAANSVHELSADTNHAIATPSSTRALGENSAPALFNFSNYYEVALNVDLAGIAESIEGNVYVVKVIDHDANALFVGSYETLDTLTMELVLPLAHDSVIVEIYSDLDGQGVMVEEKFL